ncbi:hypothetical protein K470DRAFT_156763 [Piedraia hortae CBS 480.64]|uniref:DUF2293 domain-containing protein n=1 Tax=Piedraia hortae CBS 480.64 TaxID=1314780 RepID=A0A6A7BSY5_9PEZI|nr:hypothetical protein K470DRAFT_156763 [Piedraia hortae CBS 480.64]
MESWALKDLFPQIPADDLERVLDFCVIKPFAYDLSRSKSWNSKRLNSFAIAHGRHAHTNYESLLKQGVNKFEARKNTSHQVDTVLRRWSP